MSEDTPTIATTPTPVGISRNWLVGALVAAAIIGGLIAALCVSLGNGDDERRYERMSAFGGGPSGMTGGPGGARGMMGGGEQGGSGGASRGIMGGGQGMGGGEQGGAGAGMRGHMSSGQVPPQLLRRALVDHLDISKAELNAAIGKTLDDEVEAGNMTAEAAKAMKKALKESTSDSK